ncbi:hypothetical protein MKEN_01049500 [Mycena kentingensis (nom. inval.)]|nr:hypothetical protein MKEN_01049500 [Mycena kentingensis (nom. inval.)]
MATMENPHAERQSALLDRIINTSARCTDAILEINHHLQDIIRANEKVRIAADLSSKYRRNIQYNLQMVAKSEESTPAS